MNILTIYGADERRFAEASLYPDMQLARITSQYKDMYKVITQNGERFAEVSGNFRYKAQSASEFPTVGDFVMTNIAEEPCDNLAIHELLSRKSLFERRALELVVAIESARINRTVRYRLQHGAARLARMCAVRKAAYTRKLFNIAKGRGKFGALHAELAHSRSVDNNAAAFPR